jgi:hypothetical protein
MILPLLFAVVVNGCADAVTITYENLTEGTCLTEGAEYEEQIRIHRQLNRRIQGFKKQLKELRKKKNATRKEKSRIAFLKKQIEELSSQRKYRIFEMVFEYNKTEKRDDWDQHYTLVTLNPQGSNISCDSWKDYVEVEPIPYISAGYYVMGDDGSEIPVAVYATHNYRKVDKSWVKELVVEAVIHPGYMSMEEQINEECDKYYF